MEPENEEQNNSLNMICMPFHHKIALFSFSCTTLVLDNPFLFVQMSLLIHSVFFRNKYKTVRGRQRMKTIWQVLSILIDPTLITLAKKLAFSVFANFSKNRNGSEQVSKLFETLANYNRQSFDVGFLLRFSSSKIVVWILQIEQLFSIWICNSNCRL